MDVVLKLRELRRIRGLTQKEAAEKSGVGVKTISSFETGDRIGSMRLDQFLSLLAAYDTTPAEFFGGAVERDVFAELERLTPEESRFIAELRAIDTSARARLIAKFIGELTAVRTALPALRVAV